MINRALQVALTLEKEGISAEVIDPRTLIPLDEDAIVNSVKKTSRVPFEHMIYIGDGPSDIPCFSMIKNLGGSVVGVITPEDSDLTKPYELAQGERWTSRPYTADYSDRTDLYKMLARYVDGIADDIIVSRAEITRPAPSH